MEIEIDTLKEEVPEVPLSPTSPMSVMTDDSEPPISLSQPLGRRPMGLVNTGKAAVLPALPPQIFAKLQSKTQSKIQRVQTWPPAARNGDALSSAAQAAAQAAIQSLSPPKGDVTPDPDPSMLNAQQHLKNYQPDVVQEEDLNSNSTADMEPESTAQQAVPLALLRLREAQQRRRQIASAAAAS